MDDFTQITPSYLRATSEQLEAINNKLAAYASSMRVSGRLGIDGLQYIPSGLIGDGSYFRVATELSALQSFEMTEDKFKQDEFVI
jgi:hypothetical protein